MKKILILVCVLLLVSSNQLFSQLKTYNGTYGNGIAQYTYIQNEDMTRNFQGSFKYSAKGLQVTGQYKDDLKDGKWYIRMIFI